MRSDPAGDRDGSPRRLWVEFERWRPPGLEPGQPFGLTGPPRPRTFGVTGLDAADCWRRVRDLVGDDIPPVRVLVWDVDVSSVGCVPTGNPAALGIWYAG